MLNRALAIGIGLVVAAGSPALADEQVWTAFTFFGPVARDSRVLVWFDGHARFREGGEALDTTILRPGVGWRVSPKLDLWAGYASITTQRAGPNLHEQRLWQQATYPIAKPAGGALTGRTRIEQRFRKQGDDTGWRVRQLVRFGRPIQGTPFSLVAQNEFFYAVNSTDWGQRDGFDQNRAFVGGAWQARRNLRLEAGYLNHRINGGASPDRINHNLSLGAFASF